MVSKAKPQASGCAVKRRTWSSETTLSAIPALPERANKPLASGLKNQPVKSCWKAMRLTPKPRWRTGETRGLKHLFRATERIVQEFFAGKKDSANLRGVIKSTAQEYRPQRRSR